MAAFTTALLIGLAASGAFTAGSKLGAKKQANADQQAADAQAQQATGPNPTANQVPTPPPSTPAAASKASASATTVAQRQRKRASAGNTILTGPIASPGKGPWSEARPKTLLGA
jgi:hypothetical protein